MRRGGIAALAGAARRSLVAPARVAGHARALATDASVSAAIRWAPHRAAKGEPVSFARVAFAASAAVAACAAASSAAALADAARASALASAQWTARLSAGHEIARARERVP